VVLGGRTIVSFFDPATVSGQRYSNTLFVYYSISLTCTFLARVAEEVKSNISKTFSTGLDSSQSRKRLHTLTKLSELRICGRSGDSPKKLPYAFLWEWDWSDAEGFDIFSDVFEKIVEIAIFDTDNLNKVSEAALTFLKELSEDGEL
jgi:hypothetical protein